MSVTAESGGAPRPTQSASNRLALVSLSLTTLMASLDTSIANVGLPTLARAFHASFQQVQWVVLAYLLATTALIVSAGRLGDIVGRKRLLLGGIALFTFASLLCGAASTLSLLIAARAMQGVGAAIMMSLTLALSVEVAPRARTGSAMGLVGTMSAIGTTMGPSLGGMVITGFGWPMIFLVNVPIGVVAFVLALRTLPADNAETASKSRFQLGGTLILAASLAAYSLSMTIGNGKFRRENLALLLLAALGGALFASRERRSTSPLIHGSVFRDATLAAGLVMNILVLAAMMTTLVVGPFYLAHTLGLAPSRVGLIMSVGPLVAMLAGIPAGHLVDRFGARRATVAGVAGLSAGLLALSIAPGAYGVAGYIASIAIVTAHYALFQTANNTALLSRVPSGERGMVSGLLNLSRSLGLITGASAMGAVYAVAGLRITFILAATVVGTAYLVMAIAIHFVRPHNERYATGVGHPELAD